MNRLWILSTLLHAYVAQRLVPGVAALAGAGWAIALAGLLLASALLVPQSLRRHRGRRSAAEQRRADRLAWASLGLMGLFSSLFVLTLLRDGRGSCSRSSPRSTGPRCRPAGRTRARRASCSRRSR